LKKIVIFLFLFISSPLLFAQFTIKPEFDINTNDEMAKEDFYNLNGSLKFKFQVTDDIELVFKPELDKYEVDVDDLYAKISFLEKHSVQGGKFENILSLDDYLGTFGRPFARKNLVTREMKNQGYISYAIGARYEYRDKSKDGWGGFAHVIYIPSQFEPQLNAGIYWQDKKKDMLAGLFASYYPFLSHENWGSEHCKSNRDNFIGDLVFSDYRNKIIYGAELTLGANLINPVGHINFDPDTKYPAFAGADLHAGIDLRLNDYINWLRALRTTMLIPEISEAKCNEFEILWGNQFSYKRNVKLHLDGGIGIVTKYDTYGDDDLKTKLEWRWTVSLVIKG